MGRISDSDAVVCAEMPLSVLLESASKMDKNDGDEGRELATTTDEGDEVSKRLERLLLAGLLGALMHRPRAFGEVGGVSIGCVVLVSVSELGMKVSGLLRPGDEDDRASWLEQLIIGDIAKRPESVMP